MPSSANRMLGRPLGRVVPPTLTGESRDSSDETASKGATYSMMGDVLTQTMNCVSGGIRHDRKRKRREPAQKRTKERLVSKAATRLTARDDGRDHHEDANDRRKRRR